MTRTRSLQISISTFLIFVAGVFVWQYRENQSERNRSTPETAVETFLESDEDEGEEALDADDPLNIPETEAEAKNTSAYVVDQAVCDTECSTYQQDAEALAYCQAVCGFAPTEGGKREAPSTCDDKTETAKDICWRDKAVAERNASLCENIIDKNLRTRCQHRIAEEYFDE